MDRVFELRLLYINLDSVSQINATVIPIP